MLKSITSLNAKETLAPGTRIYYSGDQVNSPSYGTVIGFRAGNYGDTLRISFDEERFDNDPMVATVEVSNFQPGPGQRFHIALEWDAERQRKLREMFSR